MIRHIYKGDQFVSDGGKGNNSTVVQYGSVLVNKCIWNRNISAVSAERLH